MSCPELSLPPFFLSLFQSSYLLIVFISFHIFARCPNKVWKEGRQIRESPELGPPHPSAEHGLVEVFHDGKKEEKKIDYLAGNNWQTHKSGLHHLAVIQDIHRGGRIGIGSGNFRLRLILLIQRWLDNILNQEWGKAVKWLLCFFSS